MSIMHSNINMAISAPTLPFQLQSQTGPLFEGSLARSMSNNLSSFVPNITYS